VRTAQLPGRCEFSAQVSTMYGIQASETGALRSVARSKRRTALSTG
jgi:hypothetical protein